MSNELICVMPKMIFSAVFRATILRSVVTSFLEKHRARPMP
jgi:hypothetical protein